MPTNRLIGSKVATFSPDDGGEAIELHGNIASGTQTVKPRIAVHEYLKRDGAEIEFMGNSPNKFTYTLEFVGSDWRAQYLAIVSRVQKQPKGVLIDPVVGRVKVACEGFDGANFNLGQAGNAYTAPISFISDEVDPESFATEKTNSVNVRVSDVTDAIATFQLAAAPFTTAAAQVLALATSAASYADAAASSSNNNAPDASLDTRLGTVAADTEAATAAIEADPANVRAADAFDAVSAAEQVHSGCLLVAEAIDSARPVVIAYTVPADTGIIALCARLYGTRADDQIEQVLVLNRIPNPALILSGTVLRVPTPTNV